MNKEKYWKIFLKTHEKYRSWVWKYDVSTEGYQMMDEIEIGSFSLNKKDESYKYTAQLSSIPNFDKVELIQLEFENDFKEEDDSKIFFFIRDEVSGEYQSWYQKYLIQFQYKENNTWQKGHYNFKVPPIPEPDNKVMDIIFQNGDDTLVVKNVKLKLMTDQ